jgi:hypothetical protein
MGKIFRIAAGCKTGHFLGSYCIPKVPFCRLKTSFYTPKLASLGGVWGSCKTKPARTPNSASSGANHSRPRLSSLSDSIGTLETYKYLGLGTVVERDHPQISVNLI